jgi:hypothetical protein
MAWTIRGATRRTPRSMRSVSSRESRSGSRTGPQQGGGLSRGEVWRINSGTSPTQLIKNGSTAAGGSAAIVILVRIEMNKSFESAVVPPDALDVNFEGGLLRDARSSTCLGAGPMTDLGFQIGKELGEIKSRLDALESKKTGCGCKGNAVARLQPASADTEAAFRRLIASLAELQAVTKGPKLYIRSIVFTDNPDQAATETDDVCCCDGPRGRCCGPCDDPTCSEYCSSK